MKSKLLLIAFLLTVVPAVSAEQEGPSADMSHRIRTIEREIVDLTAVGDLFANTDFLALRTELSASDSTNKRQEIVTLIRSGKFTEIQSRIGVYALTGLSESNYWAATSPLLSEDTPRHVLFTTLCPGRTWSSGYANAFKFEPYASRLRTLSRSSKVHANTRSFIEDILSGTEAKRYLRRTKE
jgi:hypothetical protein